MHLDRVLPIHWLVLGWIWITLTASISLGELIEAEENHTPFLDDKNCPRKPDSIKNRKCFKKCKDDVDCRGRNKRCLCDDVCGKSCVKPTRRCQTLKPVFNGNHEIIPFNTFGAKVRYTCNDGYILSGTPERVCQGDGYWSGEPPTCETEDSFPALTGKCRDPPVVPHATHDGPTTQNVYPLGTQLTYTCASGYNIDGFFRAMCVGEGRWVGPRMTCSPRTCPHPGDIPNGRREGNVFIFPNSVTYACSEGYELHGQPFRRCEANGHWSYKTPTCKPVICPQLSAPNNGQMHGKEFTYGAVVRSNCFRGFQLLGSGVRRCQQDGTWSGQMVSCAMVDCGLPGPFYNGYLDGQQTTFGAVIIFRCFGRTTFQGDSVSTTCQDNGEWSHSVPKCWSKCNLPTITNGTIKGNLPDVVNHGQTIEFDCASGFKLNTTEDPRCYNGSWTFTPTCKPAPCDNVRPHPLKDGIVRYHGIQHGDKAKYKCNAGYKLEDGDTYITCQFGKWIGRDPYCKPLYCPYPGVIKNGQILLVGVIGKYEYRQYVRRIGHNEQIEFQCNKGFKRVGPLAATCVDGFWSPDIKPHCVPGQHPRLLYIFRGKRSAISNSTNSEEEEMPANGTVKDQDVTFYERQYPGLKFEKLSDGIKDEEPKDGNIRTEDTNPNLDKIRKQMDDEEEDKEEVGGNGEAEGQDEENTIEEEEENEMEFMNSRQSKIYNIDQQKLEIVIRQNHKTKEKPSDEVMLENSDLAAE